MQTFSIAAQQFGAFNFGVDSSNTAIVTFSYPDPHDASRVLVARFNRNGEHVMTAEPPRMVPEPMPQVRADQQLDASQRDVISSSGPGPVYDRATGDGTSRDQSA